MKTAKEKHQTAPLLLYQQLINQPFIRIWCKIPENKCKARKRRWKEEASFYPDP